MRWTVGIVGFFAVVLAVNGVLAYSAFTSGSGLLEDSPYERGLRHQEIISKKKSAVSSGLRPKIAFERVESSEDRVLRVSLRDPDGKVVTVGSVEVRGKFAAEQGHDFNSRLAEQSDGTYSAKLSNILPGIWFVDIEVEQEVPSASNTLLWQKRVVIS